ncbi:MAG: nucleoside transporter C-terminal domain-containing protein [Bacteroidota bacterium]
MQKGSRSIVWGGVLLSILCVVLGSPLKASVLEDSLRKSLGGQWYILSQKTTQGTDTFALKDQKRFFIDVQKGTFEEILGKDTLRGRWDMEEDSLVLYHGFKPVDFAVDSVHYRANEGGAQLSLYDGGERKAWLEGKELGSAREEERLHVTLNDRGHPTLTNTDRTLSLGYFELAREPFSYMDLIRGLIGILSMLGIAWLFSQNRKAIDWKLVGIGVGLQIAIAVLVLQAPVIGEGINAVAGGLVTLLGYSDAGAEFMFGSLIDTSQFGYIFAFKILPTIVFFSALMAVLYYLGVLQKVVYAFAWVMSKTMRLSGAESLAAAGNIFVGQTEAPLLVRPYLERMTRSEIMALMTGGFATIAGGVFAAYVDYLGGGDKAQQLDFAKHLITASVMSAPAAIVLAKIIVPETEEVNRDLKVPKDKIGANVLDALSNGILDGLKLAVNVGVMLMVFTAMMAMLNGFFGSWIGEWTGLNDWVVSFTDGRYNEFNLQFILGLVGAPIAWLLGVPNEDILLVGQLLGEKTILNEFFAYASLGEIKEAGLIVNYKSVVIATYALCGFANFASIGIQIGGIGTLAPNKRKMLSQLGLRALLAGTLAAFLTATIAGVLVGF